MKFSNLALPHQLETEAIYVRRIDNN